VERQKKGTGGGCRSTWAAHRDTRSKSPPARFGRALDFVSPKLSFVEDSRSPMGGLAGRYFPFFSFSPSLLNTF